MALKRQFPPLATFSMSSMTDVIFLLLIFFMVTSTLIFPAAMEVNLPQAGVQTQLKPQTEIYLDSLANIFFVADRNDTTAGEAAKPRPVSLGQLDILLADIHRQDSTRAAALYADRSVRYEKVIEILEAGARADTRIVLATKASEQEK